MKNPIDSLVMAVSPARGVRRLAARRTAAILNSGYGNGGASLVKKSMRGWMFRGGSAKEDIEDNLDVLRQRSRDAYMNVPMAATALKTLRTNVIAGGLMPTPQVDGEALGLTPEQVERLQADILREFSLWADTAACDADGLDDFYQLQQLAFLSGKMNGDVFTALSLRPQRGQVYDLRLRVVEADRVCSPDGFDRLSPCEVRGVHVERIVQGVETDREGRVAAYWICSQHPLAGLTGGEPPTWTRVTPRGDKTGRRNFLHVLTRERAGQLRGVPYLAPVLESLKQLGRYTEAEINAAVISAMFTAFIQPELLSDERPLGEMIPAEERVDDADLGSIELGNGAIVSLNPGEKVTFADPKHPTTAYDAFLDAQTKQVGSALEIPPEVMDKKFSTSYSASRGALNEFWRFCEMCRDWFASDFCQPIYEEWLAEAVAKGRISAPGFFADPAIRKAYCNCGWSGPARSNLNPVQEVEAAIKRIDAGFSTAQEETAQMTGGNYARNIRQRTVEAAQRRAVDGSNKEGQEDG